MSPVVGKSKCVRLCVGFVLAAFLAMVHMEQAAAEQNMERTITVQASGSIEVEPDSARINSGVMTTAKTAREALDRNSSTMASVIDGLKAAGIKSRDIQTSSFNVQPRYKHNRDGRPPEVTGYQVTNQLSVRLRRLEDLGEILDRLVTLGANQMHGLQFFVAEEEQFKDDARVKAMENARRRAEIYAAAAGAKVGKVIQITEGVIRHDPVPHVGRRATMASESVPIETGTESLEVQVTVTWELE